MSQFRNDPGKHAESGSLGAKAREGFFLATYDLSLKTPSPPCILSRYLLLSKSYKKFDTLVAATAVHMVTVVHQSCGERTGNCDTEAGH